MGCRPCGCLCRPGLDPRGAPALVLLCLADPPSGGRIQAGGCGRAAVPFLREMDHAFGPTLPVVRAGVGGQDGRGVGRPAGHAAADPAAGYGGPAHHGAACRVPCGPGGPRVGTAAACGGGAERGAAAGSSGRADSAVGAKLGAAVAGRAVADNRSLEQVGSGSSTGTGGDSACCSNLGNDGQECPSYGRCRSGIPARRRRGIPTRCRLGIPARRRTPRSRSNFSAACHDGRAAGSAGSVACPAAAQALYQGARGVHAGAEHPLGRSDRATGRGDPLRRPFDRPGDQPLGDPEPDAAVDVLDLRGLFLRRLRHRPVLVPPLEAGTRGADDVDHRHASGAALLLDHGQPLQRTVVALERGGRTRLAGDLRLAGGTGRPGARARRTMVPGGGRGAQRRDRAADRAAAGGRRARPGDGRYLHDHGVDIPRGRRRVLVPPRQPPDRRAQGGPRPLHAAGHGRLLADRDPGAAGQPGGEAGRPGFGDGSSGGTGGLGVASTFGGRIERGGKRGRATQPGRFPRGGDDGGTAGGRRAAGEHGHGLARPGDAGGRGLAGHCRFGLRRFPLPAAPGAGGRDRLGHAGLSRRLSLVGRRPGQRRSGGDGPANAGAGPPGPDRSGDGRPGGDPGGRCRIVGASGSSQSCPGLSGRLRRRGGGGTVVGHGQRRPIGRERRFAGRDPLYRLWPGQLDAHGPLAPPRTELPGAGAGRVGRVVGFVVAVGCVPHRTRLGRRVGDRSDHDGCGRRGPATLCGRGLVRPLEDDRRRPARDLGASQPGSLAGRSLPYSLDPRRRGGCGARRGADRLDGLERRGDYRRFAHAGADRGRRGDCRGLLLAGVALSLVHAELDRFVGRVGRHVPHAEFQLFPLRWLPRPQCDDRAFGPRHLGRVGGDLLRPAAFRGKGPATGDRRAAGQLRAIVVGRGVAGDLVGPQCRQSLAGLLFPLAGRRVAGICLAESLGRMVRRPSSSTGLCGGCGHDCLAEARRLDHALRIAADAQSPGTDGQRSSCGAGAAESSGLGRRPGSAVAGLGRGPNRQSPQGRQREAVVARPRQRRLVRPPWSGRNAGIAGRRVYACRSLPRTARQRDRPGRDGCRPRCVWPHRLESPGRPGRNALRHALGKVEDRRTGRHVAAGRHAALPDRRPLGNAVGRGLGAAVGTGHPVRNAGDGLLATRPYPPLLRSAPRGA